MYGGGLLMMSAWRSKQVELYTYRQKIKIYHKLHLLVYFLECMKMHGTGNIKFDITVSLSFKMWFLMLYIFRVTTLRTQYITPIWCTIILICWLLLRHVSASAVGHLQGAHKLFETCSLRVKLCGRYFTDTIEIIITIKILKSLKSVCG
jgi:hypothetical protein